MSLPSNFPGEKSYRIVCGGDINDYDPQKLSLMKTFDPTRHKFPEVSPQQLPFIGTERTATQCTLERFEAPPEQGSVVIVSQDRGFPTSAAVTGTVSGTELNSAQNVAGNSGLYELLRIVSQISTKKRIKPQIVERMVNNVLVREKQEKGQDWKHDLTRGIPTNAAFSQVFGQLLKEVKNIETALQSFANIPSFGALSQLPGQTLNLASIFKNLTKQQKNRATQRMSPELVAGLENMFLLMSDVSADSNMYVASDRINPEVYTENMIELLSQCDNIGDLLDCIHRLNYDESIRGLEAYSKKTDSGLKANIIETDPSKVYETTDLLLSDIVENSKVHFDVGYSLNISNRTYIVSTAELSSNTITVYPKVEEKFENAVVYVYEPILEYQVDDSYGQMTMTMDFKGNVRPKKDSLQQLQQAIQSLVSLLNSAEAAGKGKFLFDDAAKSMSEMFTRLPPGNIRQQILSEVSRVAKQKLDPINPLIKGTTYPFGSAGS